jgi:hypothetical protein
LRGSWDVRFNEDHPEDLMIAVSVLVERTK